MPRNISWEKFEQEMTKLSEGWDKSRPADLTSLYIGGKEFTAAQMGEELRSIVGHLKRVDSSLRAYRAAVQFRDQHLAQWLAVQTALRDLLRQRLGPKANLLLPFGLAPPRPRARPSEATLLVAVDKRRKTRRLRGTMGPRQKQRITLQPEPTIRIIDAEGQPVAPPPPPIPRTSPRKRRRKT
jgi:hypothetical protein